MATGRCITLYVTYHVSELISRQEFALDHSISDSFSIDEDDQFDLASFLSILRKSWLLISTMALAGCLIAFGVTIEVVPVV
jgi:hypothetical protein